MGKDLKGKSLGVGICQRKDGLYYGRFVSKRTGKSVESILRNCKIAVNGMLMLDSMMNMVELML